MSSDTYAPTPSIIFFDGVCNLCNGFVRFIISHDPKGYFLFSSLQSPEAAEILNKHGVKASLTDGVVLLENDKIYFKSKAGFRILKKLEGWPKLFSAFMIFPSFISDVVYDVIANKRYRWFGKKEECMVPDDELKKRFVG